MNKELSNATAHVGEVWCAKRLISKLANQPGRWRYTWVTLVEVRVKRGIGCQQFVGRLVFITHRGGYEQKTWQHRSASW